MNQSQNAFSSVLPREQQAVSDEISYAMRWPVKVTPGEEAVWISLIVSLGMVMLTILVLWLWPDLLER